MKCETRVAFGVGVMQCETLGAFGVVRLRNVSFRCFWSGGVAKCKTLVVVVSVELRCGRHVAFAVGA